MYLHKDTSQLITFAKECQVYIQSKCKSMISEGSLWFSIRNPFESILLLGENKVVMHYIVTARKFRVENLSIPIHLSVVLCF